MPSQRNRTSSWWYPHEKLDPKHTRDQKFDNLDVHLLVAGALEIAALPDISKDEREAQIQIAKTICYHKKYVQDSDLQEGYDTILKQIEQGKLQWKDDLGQKLHEHLDYRANVIIRNKIAQQEAKSEQRKSHNNKKLTTQDGGNPKDRVIYCLEYNQGTCPHSDHHEGRFNRKKVFKFHICQRCHKEGDFKSHQDASDECPKKIR